MGKDKCFWPDPAATGCRPGRVGYLAMVSAALLLGLGGCSHPDESEREVLNKPTILLDQRVPYTELSMGGIHLGDSEGSISHVRKTTDPNAAGDHWVYCTNGTAFKIRAGKVVTLQLNDPVRLAQLGLNSEADVKSKLGDPSAEPAPGDLRYDSRHLTVMTAAEGLTLVNVFN